MQAASLLSLRSKTSPISRDNLLGVIEMSLDSVILITALLLVALRLEGEIRPAHLLLSVLLFSLTFPGASHLHYTVWRLVMSIMVNWLWIAALLLILGFSSHYIDEFSREFVVTWLWVAPLAQIGAHLALRAMVPFLIKLQGPPSPAIIVGGNEQGQALAARIRENGHLNISVNGFFDDRKSERLNENLTIPLLGRLSDLTTYVKGQHIKFIYLSLPMSSQPRILQIIDELKDTTASIYFVPDMFITDLVQGRSGSICGIPVISVCETPFTGASGAVKRLSDILLACLILVLIFPLMAIIATAIKLETPGAAIFKQRRYGLDGEEIVVYKFRSMTVSEDGSIIRQAQKNDARITRLGAFLRKSSLDELPQFVNVLQGRMSIVGPRPHAVAHNELYRTLIKGYMIRHKVKPGITGWAQVNGYRGETNTLDKMQGRINYDLDYLRNWSLKLDLIIIAKTVLVIFKDNAAY